MKYLYFVSYQYKTGNVAGIGQCEVLRDKKINSSEDIRGIVDDLKNEISADIVVMITYILMSEYPTS